MAICSTRIEMLFASLRLNYASTSPFQNPSHLSLIFRLSLTPDFVFVKETSEYHPGTQNLWHIFETADLARRHEERPGKKVSGQRPHNQPHADQPQHPVITLFRCFRAAKELESGKEYHRHKRVQQKYTQRPQFAQCLERAVMRYTQARRIEVTQQERQMGIYLVIRPEIARTNPQYGPLPPYTQRILPDDDAIGING